MGWYLGHKGLLAPPPPSQGAPVACFCTFFKIFHVRLGKKTKTVSFYSGVCMYKGKTNTCQVFFPFFFTFPQILCFSFFTCSTVSFDAKLCCDEPRFPLNMLSRSRSNPLLSILLCQLSREVFRAEFSLFLQDGRWARIKQADSTLIRVLLLKYFHLVDQFPGFNSHVISQDNRPFHPNVCF